jgi:hypothetical protein
VDSSDDCNESSKDRHHTNKVVTLLFTGHPVTSQPVFSGVEPVQVDVQPTHYVYAAEMVKQLANDLDLVPLDPTRLDSCFKILLPLNYPETSTRDSERCSASLFCAVALAVNLNNIASAQMSTDSIQCGLPCLVEATQVLQIVVNSQNLKDVFSINNQKVAKLPVSSALQELATMLPTTIYVHGDVNSMGLREDTESSMKSGAQSSVVFEPKLLQYELGPATFEIRLTLGSDTSVNLAFSAYTGGFWNLVPKPLIAQYRRICKTNPVLKAKMNELCLHQGRGGAFCGKKWKSHMPEMVIASGGEQFHGLCSALHQIVFDQHRIQGLLLPAFTQQGILRMLAQQTRQTVSAASLVMQIDNLCIQSLPDHPALDRALGMVYGQHFFDPASTKYFLCVSAAFLSNWCPLPKEGTVVLMDCTKLFADSAKLLLNMGPPGSHLAPSAMSTAIAACAVLAMVMPVNQALDCWKHFNPGMVHMHNMSTGVESAGCALISLLAFARQPSEGLPSDLKSADQALHQFFELLQSEDQIVQQLKTLFLNKTESDNPFSCSQDTASIGEVLVALQLVCQNRDFLECLHNISPGKPSSSIAGLVAGALIGFSGFSKMSYLPGIQPHQSAQLRAITSVLENCYEVSLFFLFWHVLHLNLILHGLQIVLKSSLSVSPSSGSLGVGQLGTQDMPASVEIAEDEDVQEYGKDGQPPLKLLLQGPSSSDSIASGIQLKTQYEGNPVNGCETRAQSMNTYLEQLWIGKKCDRRSLVSTLSSCGFVVASSDLTCLKTAVGVEAWLTDEVMNSFMCLLSENRLHIGFCSSYLYPKLVEALQTPSEAEKLSELTRLCSWMRPKGGKRNLKGEYFVPINISRTHYTFVHVDLKISRSSDEMLHRGPFQKRHKAVPTLTYYDSYHGNFPSCLDNLEVFFKHLAAQKGYPELNCRWERIKGKGPSQHDGFNCGLFVCAGIDCLSSGIIPTGYATSTMPAFRSELLRLFMEAGFGAGLESNS